VERTLYRTTAILWLLVHALLAHASGQTIPAWTDERQAGPFVFHADFHLARQQPLLAQMTFLQRDLVAALSIRNSNEPIDVYLFADGSTYGYYMRKYFPGVPNRRAMFVKTHSPGNVFAQESDSLAVDLRHECTHALLHASLPFVPLWLDEGLAEYFEVAPDERAYGNPHLHPIRSHVRWRRPTPLDKLEALRDLNDMGQREYRDAWAWVHFMLHGSPAARIELVGFLTDLENHIPPDPLSQRLRRRIPDLDKQFAAHFKSWKR
jgi:hypothetical protein